MKKAALFMILPFSILANAAFLSLGTECLLKLLGFSMAISLDSAISVPGWMPFCMVLGVIALLGLIAIIFINIKTSEKLGFTKWMWLCEYLPAFVLSVPMIKLWDMLFDLLQKAF